MIDETAAERRRLAGVFLAFAALTVVLAYPLSIHPSDHVVSASPDTYLVMWTLAWDTHAFTHRPWAIFDANIYYPLRHTLAYSENFIGSALFAAPVLWLTSNLALALNVVTLLSAVLCGVGAYVLARAVGVSPASAVIAGLVFAFSPPRFLRITQLHLATIQWVPFGLAALHLYLDRGRARDLRLALAFLALQALTSGHGAVFLALAMALLVAWRVACGEPIALRSRLRDCGWQGLLLVAPAVVAFVPYLLVQQDVGLRRGLENWTVSPASYLASPSHVQAWLLSRFGAGHINEAADAYLFPGFLPLALAACAFVPRRRRAGAEQTGPPIGGRAAALAADVAALGALAVAAIVMVSGPIRFRSGDAVVFSVRQAWRPWLVCAVAVAVRIALAGRVPFMSAPRLRAWQAAGRRNVVAFYALLTGVSVWLTLGPPVGLWPYIYWWPGLNFIRVPSRFMLLAVLGLAILASLGLDRVSDTFTGRLKVALAALVGGLLIAEFATMPLGIDPVDLTIPTADRWLATQPTPFVVAEVPLPNPSDLGAWERRETLFMLHSTAHWQKTVHGYSGLRLPLHVELYERLTRFPDAASLAALEQLGVAYVVVHTDLYRAADLPALDDRLQAFADRLRLVHADQNGRVYALANASARRE